MIRRAIIRRWPRKYDLGRIYRNSIPSCPPWAGRRTNGSCSDVRARASVGLSSELKVLKVLKVQVLKVLGESTRATADGTRHTPRTHAAYTRGTYLPRHPTYKMIILRTQASSCCRETPRVRGQPSRVRVWVPKAAQAWNGSGELTISINLPFMTHVLTPNPEISIKWTHPDLQTRRLLSNLELIKLQRRGGKRKRRNPQPVGQSCSWARKACGRM